MAEWHAVLKDWGRREEVSVEEEHTSRLQQAITAWVAQKRRIEQMQEPGLKQGESKASKKRRRKEEVKQQVLSDWDLEADPPEGTVRGWTDGSVQTGVDGKQYAGYGVWLGELLRLCTSTPRAPANKQHGVNDSRTARVEGSTKLGTTADMHRFTAGGGHSSLLISRMGTKGWKTKSGHLVENADL